MSEIPTLHLSRLREIGWSQWDPIGLRPPDEGFVDEYDRYLLQAAAKLWRSESDEIVLEYLIHIEVEAMGVGKSPTARTRASATVSALNDYIEELRICRSN